LESTVNRKNLPLYFLCY